MHKEILDNGQLELLPLLSRFTDKFYLAGGTAVALHIGHRRSNDFDLFSSGIFSASTIFRVIEESGFKVERVIQKENHQLDLIVNSVKLTFLNYPYNIIADVKFDRYINIPDLLTLSAMKAFALAGRGKWKDYVDLAYIMKDYYQLKDISKRAKDLFKEYYSEKLFREQLCYFDDIDYSEKIDYINQGLSEEYIREFLIKQAVTII